MDLMYIILAYQRPTVLANCLNTLFNNNKVRPDLVYILDDNSDLNVQSSLLQFYLDNKTQFPVNLVLNGANLGVGHQFQTAYNLMNQHNPKTCMFVESDYIFRRGSVDDMLAILDASPYTLAMSPVSHPDMYSRDKTHKLFPELMKEQFNEDVQCREFMYAPYELETSRGKIKVQKISNSCGAAMYRWDRIQKYIFDDLGAKDEYWKWINRACHVGSDRSRASDQHMSSTITFLGEQWAKKNGILLKDYAAFLDCCDYSPSQHVCGGATSLNGKIVPENSTFVVSPVWMDWTLDRDPRLESQ